MLIFRLDVEALLQNGLCLVKNTFQYVDFSKEK